MGFVQLLSLHDYLFPKIRHQGYYTVESMPVLCICKALFHLDEHWWISHLCLIWTCETSCEMSCWHKDMRNSSTEEESQQQWVRLIHHCLWMESSVNISLGEGQWDVRVPGHWNVISPTPLVSIQRSHSARVIKSLSVGLSVNTSIAPYLGWPSTWQPNSSLQLWLLCDCGFKIWLSTCPWKFWGQV